MRASGGGVVRDHRLREPSLFIIAKAGRKRASGRAVNGQRVRVPALFAFVKAGKSECQRLGQHADDMLAAPKRQSSHSNGKTLVSSLRAWGMERPKGQGARPVCYHQNSSRALKLSFEWDTFDLTLVICASGRGVGSGQRVRTPAPFPIIKAGQSGANARGSKLMICSQCTSVRAVFRVDDIRFHVYALCHIVPTFGMSLQAARAIRFV
ncbi:hypothetical protein PLICRDRAFT_480511 [Plicaturopsis crispa FD-325 SS-3]|nr:hypothetical protein PLICRDRAFT_480511 [Plicaturopsis crispa FD-325 SS-3]